MPVPRVKMATQTLCCLPCFCRGRPPPPPPLSWPQVDVEQQLLGLLHTLKQEHDEFKAADTAHPETAADTEAVAAAAAAAQGPGAGVGPEVSATNPGSEPSSADGSAASSLARPTSSDDGGSVAGSISRSRGDLVPPPPARTRAHAPLRCWPLFARAWRPRFQCRCTRAPTRGALGVCRMPLAWAFP